MPSASPWIECGIPAGTNHMPPSFESLDYPLEIGLNQRSFFHTEDALPLMRTCRKTEVSKLEELAPKVINQANTAIYTAMCGMNNRKCIPVAFAKVLVATVYVPSGKTKDQYCGLLGRGTRSTTCLVDYAIIGTPAAGGSSYFSFKEGGIIS